MTPEEFRAAGHALIDWIADERTKVRDRRVLPSVQPGDIRTLFPADAPTGTVPFNALLQELNRVVIPGMTNVQHPMHFGWFPSNASLASVLGDIASSGLGGLGISWESNPALTEVEEVMCDWMRQHTGLSSAWHGTIHDTASSACVVALLCARERASNLSQIDGGLQANERPLVVYATDQAHSSIPKAALLAGFGKANLRYVPTNPATYAMDPAALQKAITDDIAAGRTPAAIIAAVGSTGVTAVDPVADIVAIAKPHNVWVHIDAAMYGTAMLLPEHRDLWAGVEEGDSISWNPHKWMGTILDTSLFYVRDVQHLVRVMGSNPSYLRSTGTVTEATQYRDWGIPLGRRFRSLKLWFHLQLDGIEPIRARIRRDIANAAWLEEQVRATPGWELVAPRTLQTVCMVHNPDRLTGDALDAHTLAWVKAINTSGEAFLSPTTLNVRDAGGNSVSRWIARVSVGVETTEQADVARMWSLMQTAANGLPVTQS